MEQRTVIPAIFGIGTAVPQHRVDQAEAGERLARALQAAPDAARFAKRIFKNSGVNTRYTCEEELLRDPQDCRYLPGFEDEQGHHPLTAERMEIYQREAVPLAVLAAQRAMADSAMDEAQITHLITVSCTGQFLPGLDAELVQHLGLSPRVNRLPLTFLGCAAGLKAICIARQITQRERDARVLIVCVELCTLHIQPTSAREDIFAASFFGDGASACVIGSFADDQTSVGTGKSSANEPAADEGRGGGGRREAAIILLHDDYSELLPDSKSDMTWRIGAYGFELHLSPNIPMLIGDAIRDRVERFLGRVDAEGWAIHPGGKKIVDIIQNVCQLPDEAVASSRRVLRDVGNLSSATILYVLSDMRERARLSGQPRKSGIAMAFGPGLTLEMVELTFLCSPVQLHPDPAEAAEAPVDPNRMLRV